MKFISWNVNGIRACAKKGFIDYLVLEAPDMIGLQEVKAKEDQNPILAEVAELGYETYWHAADRPGYSGTAVLTRYTPLSVIRGLEDRIEDDNEGRVLTLEFEKFFFVTVYTPNSKPDLARLAYRTRWDQAFLDFILSLEARKPVIFCGDLNVAHEDIDLRNPKENRGNAGFTDEERTGFRALLESTYTDSFRSLYPDTPLVYTWWSNFFQAREIGRAHV